MALFAIKVKKNENISEFSQRRRREEKTF